MKHAITMRWLEIEIKAIATFLMIFGAHSNILCAIKVKILLLIIDHIGPPNYVDN